MIYVADKMRILIKMSVHDALLGAGIFGVVHPFLYRYLGYL